jgi:hypothetical protein
LGLQNDCDQTETQIENHLVQPCNTGCGIGWRGVELRYETGPYGSPSYDGFNGSHRGKHNRQPLPAHNHNRASFVISSALAQFAPYIAGALAAVAALFAAYLKGGSNAKIKLHNKIAKGATARKEIRDEIDDDVRLVDAADELRRNWSRPKPR